MYPQNNFFQNALPFLLVTILIVAALFIFKKNPEIMSPEPYYEILQTRGELSASVIIYKQPPISTFNSNSENKISSNKVISSSHRYVEMKPEQFSTIPIRSHPFEWAITEQNIIVVEKNKLTITTTTGEPVRTFTPPKETQFSPGPPCLSRTALFVTTLNGRIYAFDSQTGDLLWYYQSALQFLYSPVIIDNRLVVFFSEQNKITWRYQILNSQTGDLLFRSENIEQPLVGRPLIKNEALYFATRGGRLKSVQLGTGKTNWAIDDPSDFTNQVTMAEDRLFISDESGLLQVYNSQDGRRVNEIMLQNILVGPVLHIADLNLLVSMTADRSIVGLDTKNNKALWRQSLDLQKDDSPYPKLVKLNTQSLNQLSFSSKARDLTIWSHCRSTNICIFDVKSGLLLLRLDLKGLPVAPFELLPGVGANPARLLAPLLRGNHTQIIGFANPTNPPISTTNTHPSPKPSTLTK